MECCDTRGNEHCCCLWKPSVRLCHNLCGCEQCGLASMGALLRLLRLWRAAFDPIQRSPIHGCWCANRNSRLWGWRGQAHVWRGDYLSTTTASATSARPSNTGFRTVDVPAIRRRAGQSVCILSHERWRSRSPQGGGGGGAALRHVVCFTDISRRPASEVCPEPFYFGLVTSRCSGIRCCRSVRNSVSHVA